MTYREVERRQTPSFFEILRVERSKGLPYMTSAQKGKGGLGNAYNYGQAVQILRT